MRQLIIRISFVLFLVGLYALGLYTDPILKSILGIDVEPKVLLPLISFVFYDYWLTLFTKFLVTLKIEKIFSSGRVELPMVFTYHGKDTVAISKIKLSGIADVNAKLILSPSNNETKTYCPPEKFMTYLSPTRPLIAVNIHLAFKRDPKPKLVIPIFMREVYIVKLSFKVGKCNKHKYIIISRKRREE